MNRILYSLCSGIFGLFFILIGLVGLILPWCAAMQRTFTRFIMEEGVVLSLFGSAFLLIGAAMLLYVILHARRRTYYIRGDALAIAVDEALFQRYLSLYGKELFPDKEIPWRLELRRGAVYIAVELPFLPLEAQKPFLEKLKTDLQALFADKIGYCGELRLYATFLPQEA